MLQGQFQAHHKTRNDFFYWIEREDPFQLIRKAAWLPILGCRKLVECVLLYGGFFSLPLRFARAWHSVTVSKRREGGVHSIHRRESGLIRRCLAATTSKGKICFACTFGCGGRISLFFGLKIGFPSRKIPSFYALDDCVTAVWFTHHAKRVALKA